MGAIMRTAILAIVAFGVAALLNLRLAESTLARPYDVTQVPDGDVARMVSLGHRTFVSDMYWLSAVQYIGEKNSRERGWRMLYPLVNLVTDLDPRHGYAYQTAGIVLSAEGRIEESNRILRKGMEKALRWTFPFYIAFNYWFYLGDYENAARYAQMAARAPGASANISQLAVSLSAKSGKPEDTIPVLQELRRTAQDEETAARLDEQLKLAVLERDAQSLEKAATRFRDERGRPISSLEELLGAGYVSTIPPDPFGGRYVWDPSDSRVHSSVNSFRFSIREEPKSPEPPPLLKRLPSQFDR